MSDLLGNLPYPVVSFIRIFMMLASMVGLGKLGDEVFPENALLGKLKVFFRNSAGVRTFARAYVASIFVMDVLYGRRIVALRAVITSALMSCLWVTILIVATILSKGHRAWVFDPVFAPHVVRNFWGFMVIGIVIDYLAISVTRMLLRTLPGRRAGAVFIALAAAMVGVASLFYICFNAAKALFLGQAINGNPLNELATWAMNPESLMLVFQTLNDWHLTETAPGLFKIHDGNSEVVYAFPEGLLFLSSQLALLWLALHAFAHWLYFGGYSVSRWVKRLVDAAAFDNRPLQSSAMVTALLMLLPIWMASLAWHYSPAVASALGQLIR